MHHTWDSSGFLRILGVILGICRDSLGFMGICSPELVFAQGYQAGLGHFGTLCGAVCILYICMCEGKSRSRTNLIGLKSPQVHGDSTMLMVYCAVWLCAKHCLLSYFPSITRPCKEWLMHNICTYVVHRIKYSFLMTIIVLVSYTL